MSSSLDQNFVSFIAEEDLGISLVLGLFKASRRSHRDLQELLENDGWFCLEKFMNTMTMKIFQTLS
jgi:hypothetical protein